MTGNKKAKYLAQCPTYGELDFILPEGFVDDTTHEDDVPKFIRQISGERYLRLTADYLVQSERMHPDEARFALHLCDEELNAIADLEFTDDIVDVIEFLSKHTIDGEIEIADSRKPGP